MNIQFRSYHRKYYTEFDPKSVLYGYRNFSLDNEQCVWIVTPTVASNMTVRILINREYGNPITFQYCGRQTSFSRG